MPSRRAPPADAAAVGEGELGALFAPLAGHPALALAVSGGPDSAALLLLAARWRRRLAAPPALTVLTVDHRLRPGSAAEAALVASLAAREGLPARILVWAAPTGDSEAAAREARYRLLAGAAGEIGATALVLAHHREDQAETFLMRLAAGSGPRGLGAMAPAAERDGLLLLRPFLDLPKARLAATVAAAGVVPVTDESNSDRRYLRPRLRALMPALAEEGLGPERLARGAARMRRVADALDHYAGGLLAEAAASDALAVVSLARAPFAAAPEEVRLRALELLLRAIGGGAYPPRSERLEALAAAMAAGARFRRTLAGVTVETEGGGFRLWRESGRVGLPEVSFRRRFAGVWDRRFALSVEAEDEGEGEGLTLGPLGTLGRAALGSAAGRPAAALAALPAIRRGGRLVAVPALGLRPSPAERLRVEARCVLLDRIQAGDRAGNPFTLE